ncbi:hypothetical protein CEUSTIGMA_g6017.t1 [Chlamydomonas eustigma]|uniref:Uncharacterized protein n=1 Tax=Chlamydomonas eustigma TaxID=1157962 RepID=A0A250X676_9CHLO|nr:hypothetical protein CEUSTIGMA_g6017.t1 [Chlamydomonas eustigma]|eukprot:GAX78578.1 hypothetical protein CEUSTIGMA_g6017.t1 [Chlamydomonas eustigma]
MMLVFVSSLFLYAVNAAPLDLGSTSPLLLWSSEGLVGKGRGSHVTYSVLSDASEAAADAVREIFGKRARGSGLIQLNQEERVDDMTVVLFAGSQLSSPDLRQGKAEKLSAILGAAASSLVIPYTAGQSRHAATSIQSQFEQEGLLVKSIGCSSAINDLVKEVTDALGNQPSPQVLIVCPQLDPSLVSEQAGLEEELNQLLMVQEALDASQTKHTVVYTTQHYSTHERRRTMLSSSSPPPQISIAPLTGFGNYTTCGTLCLVQVRWLEGMLAVLFLAVASCAGLTCLNLLNTPTRYEVAAE